MDNLNTFDSLMDGFRKLSEERNPVNPQQWLSGALKLNVLLDSEIETLIHLEFILANMRKELLEKDKTSAYTRMMVEASEEYKTYQQQKAKIKNAEETIKLAKKYAQVTSDLMRNNL